MFAGLINQAKSAVSHLVLQYVARASVAVPFIIALGFALAAITVLLVNRFGHAAAYAMMAGGLAAIGVVAAIAVGVLPALIAGALLSSFVKSVLYESPAVFAATFIIGGVVMLAVERFRPTPVIVNAEQTPLGRAFGVGLCQMLAIIPGVSRSGATIVGGMLMGLDRAAAAELSFFLAIPTMIAAFGHDLLDVRASLGPERALECRAPAQPLRRPNRRN